MNYTRDRQLSAEVISDFFDAHGIMNGLAAIPQAGKNLYLQFNQIG